MPLSVKEAGTRLDELLMQAAAGHKVEIRSGDGRVFQLVMPPSQPTKRIGNLHPNALTMREDFDDEDPEINSWFYGEESGFC